MATEKNLNPKDVKDLAKALTAALSTMKSLSAAAEEFNKNIGGAKDTLNEMSNSTINRKNDSENITKQAGEELKALEKINNEYDKVEQSQKKISKNAGVFKNTLIESGHTITRMIGASGFGGVFDVLSSIKDSFSGGFMSGVVNVLMSAATFIFNKFLEIDNQVESISQSLGRGGKFARDLAGNSFRISRDLASYGVSMADATEAAISLGSEFGNLEYVTGNNQKLISLMGKQLGVGSSASTKMLSTFMSMSGSSLKTAEQMASVAMSMARTSKLPLKSIMEDLSGNSEAAAKYGGKFAQSTMIASAMAKKIGMSFGDVAKIAEGLLDIENSVSKQFEAQVLLGRNVNLEQARYYALIGDTNKLQREVLKQVGSQAEFEKMMPMQRQALADAIGVGVEQLGKMVSRGKEALSVEEKTYNLQKQSLDQQLRSSEVMMGIVSQIEGALTELGYAIMGTLFGTDIPELYEKSAEMGEKFVGMIRELTTNLKNGQGPLFEFIQGIKEFFSDVQVAINWVKEWKTTILQLVGTFYAFKFLTQVGKWIWGFATAAETAGVSTKFAYPSVSAFFRSLAAGLESMGPYILALPVLAYGLDSIAGIFLGIGQSITGMAKLTESLLYISEVDTDKIKTVFESIKTNAVAITSNAQFKTATAALHDLGNSMYNISKFGGSGGVITVKTQAEASTELKNYHTDSLKYLKVIALATTMMAETTTKKNIRYDRLENDISNYILT